MPRPDRKPDEQKPGQQKLGAAYKLIGKDYTTPDLYAKVTGKAKYAEDFRAEGMFVLQSCCSVQCRTDALNILI